MANVKPDHDKTITQLRKKYPSPRPDDEVFTKYWKEFIIDIPKRVNFKTNHLFNLKILCNLYSEYEALEAQIQNEGTTYICGTKYGEQIKDHPAVTQRNKVMSEIRNFTKLFDAKPAKDTPNEAPPTEASNEWSE